MLCCACNSDIFVEPVPDIENNKFELYGNGGTASFTITTRGLLGVHFGSENSPQSYVIFYDKDDDYLYNPNLENVAKVVYYSPFFCLQLEIDGNRVKATALDNTSKKIQEVWVSLNYEHQSRYVDFTITPGLPLQIEHLGFDILKRISGKATERSIPHTFTNSTDHTQRIVIYPYKDAFSKIKLEVEDYIFWARGVEGKIEIPFYTDGEWIDSKTNVAEVRLGDITQFYSPDVDIEESYTVDVPPHTKVTTITEVTYATLDVAYLGELIQPGSKMMFPIQGQSRLMQPISYKITENFQNTEQ